MREKFFRVWAIWCLIFTFTSLLTVTPFYWLIFKLGGNKAFQVGHIFSRFLAFYALFFYRVRLRVSGKDNLTLSNTYIIVSNHASHLDTPVGLAAFPYPVRFLAKEELKKAPFLGYIISNMHLTVSRGNHSDRVKSVEKMRAALLDGTSLWLFPEGTRNRGNVTLNKFYDGAFRLAAETGYPMIVATLIGTGNRLGAKSLLRFTPGKVKVMWSSPMVSHDQHLLKQYAWSELERNLSAYENR